MHATSIFACLLLLALIARVEAQQPQRKGRYAIGVNYPAHMYYIPKVQQLPSSFPTHEPKHTTPRQATASPLKLLRGLPCGTAAWEFRTFDGQCNNLQRPSLGSSNTGQLLHKRRTSSRPSGQNRPNARFISNTLSRQVIEDKPNRRGMSEFLTFFGQFLDHNLVATPATKPEERMDIPVPRADASFWQFHPNSTKKMKFSRSARGKYNGQPSAINSFSSFFDLKAVYGDNEDRAKALRTMRSGRLEISHGNYLPFNTRRMTNAPSTSKEFYVAGDFRANEHVGLTALHIIWMREHNKLCDSLKKDFPGWGDERLYQMARKINGASFQQVVYEEFYPALTGRILQKYRGYNPKINPSISALFSTAAYRIGHTLVGPDVRRFGSGNAPLPPLKLGSVFFTAPQVLKRMHLDQFVRGMLNTRAQEVDVETANLIRDFLFLKVEHEDVFDLIATNIQRGRDHALPSYNEVRVIMGRQRAKSYDEVTNNKAVSSKLQKAYGPGNVDRIDAWVGLLAEPHMPRASMGYTMFLIFKQEFTRTRDGDRFFYARPGLFTRQVQGTMYRHGKRRMRDIILRNTGLSPSEVKNPFWTLYTRKRFPPVKGGKGQGGTTPRVRAFRMARTSHFM